MYHHWGYHNHPQDFEGWYLRLSLPEIGESLAFMYEVRPSVGASLQILGIGDGYLYQPFAPELMRADVTNLALESNYFSLSDRHHRGQVGGITWEYQITDQVPWRGATMGWLSYLPVFAPYWQIMQLFGRAKGWVQWYDQRYPFVNAPIYSEKNWGQSFPPRWYWLHCHHWQNQPDTDLAIVSAGGIRNTFGQDTIVAMVGIYWRGKTYAFMPHNSQIFCSIKSWGDWYIIAVQGALRLEIIGTCTHPPTPIQVPINSRMEFACRDTGKGNLRINLWRNDRRLLRVTSDHAALETGGDWGDSPSQWQFTSARF